MTSYETKSVYAELQYQSVESVLKIPNFMHDDRTIIGGDEFEGPEETKWRIEVQKNHPGYVGVFANLESSQKEDAAVLASVSFQLDSDKAKQCWVKTTSMVQQ